MIMENIRQSSVAGLFYPADPEELKQIAKEPYSSHEEFNNNLIGYF